MPKFVAALALIAAASSPSFAQSAPTTTNQAQASQPQQYQVVKKRVCKTEDADDIGSRITTRQVCKMVEEKVPVPASGQQNPQTAPTPNAIR